MSSPRPHPTPNALAGVVMAGGYSRRMGRDKAALRVKGKALWRRQAAVLSAAGAGPVWIGRRRDQAKLGRGAHVVFDELEGVGPIAGLHAALAACAGEWVAVLAVDMPAIDAGWFDTLRAKCARGVGAVVQHADGFEPLAAIYPREALAIVNRRVRAERYSLQDLVKALVRAKRIRVVRLPAGERWRVANWNEPVERGGWTPLLADVARHGGTKSQHGPSSRPIQKRRQAAALQINRA